MRYLGDGTLKYTLPPGNYTMFLVGLHFDILITQILSSILVNVIAQKVFKFVHLGLSVMEFGFSLAMRLVNVLKLI